MAKVRSIGFQPDWHTDFLAGIATHNVRAFKDAGIDLLMLEGKVLCVRSFVGRDYGPTVILTNPTQIDVLAGR